MYRSIEKIISAPPFHMVGDGFRVHNFIPGAVSMERMNPIIMMDYNSKHYFPPTDNPRGVDVHPHRGFETITIAYKGKIAHHDSKGNSGIIGEGEVQWMTAASGILHKEYHEKEFSKKGGDFQMVQLWLNLPAKYKMSEPKYQNLDKESIKKVSISEHSFVEIIAGEYDGVQGPASSFTPALLMNAYVDKNDSCEIIPYSHHNTCMVVVEGSIIVNQASEVSKDQFVLFNNEEGRINILAKENAIILIISVEPINEPIAAYGPFVMNTKQELQEAFQDFQNGKFGVLN
ncbi:MAG: pirin family protein [Saprospiraceae bacterium]|nr:pirin family protein [Saprospiraceae bacterium]